MRGIEGLHFLMAVFSVFRLTNLLVGDTILDPIRERFPEVPWRCPNCMSVWAGIASVACFSWIPWVNWPLAMSWFYQTYGEWVTSPFVENRRLRMEIMEAKRKG